MIPPSEVGASSMKVQLWIGSIKRCQNLRPKVNIEFWCQKNFDCQPGCDGLAPMGQVQLRPGHSVSETDRGHSTRFHGLGLLSLFPDCDNTAVRSVKMTVRIFNLSSITRSPAVA